MTNEAQRLISLLAFYVFRIAKTYSFGSDGERDREAEEAAPLIAEALGIEYSPEDTAPGLTALLKEGGLATCLQISDRRGGGARSARRHDADTGIDQSRNGRSRS